MTIEQAAVPPDIRSLIDRIVASAYGQELSNDDPDRLFDWLLYESESLDLESIECFVHLDEFRLPDQELREEIGLSESCPLTDTVLLNYVCNAIRAFNDGGGTVLGSTTHHLRDSLGRETYACWLSETIGQGGEISYWKGCFPSKEAFFLKLRNDGWWNLRDDLNELTAERVKRAWSRSP